MVSQCWNYAFYPNATALFSQPISSPLSDSCNFRMPRKSKSCFRAKITCLQLDIVEVAHNKVLVAAGVSAAIGQLSKPFTSVLLYGKDFDFKIAFQAGGFPSTHSSAVIASATSLALERGLSDSIFGLTLVYAGLVMYDAQGVRREVGNHAKLLNRLASEMEVKLMVSNDGEDCHQLEDDVGPLSPMEERPRVNELANASLLVKSENKTRKATQKLTSSKEKTRKTLNSFYPLKESIGHTEVEVIAGALLGFFVSLAVYATL